MDGPTSDTKASGGTGSEGTDLADMYKFAAIAACIAAFAMYVKALQNREHWFILEMCIGVVSLACLPFSGSIFPVACGMEADHQNLFLVRCIILATVTQASVIFFTKKSTDQTVAIAVSIHNILLRSLLVLCVLYKLTYFEHVTASMKGDLVLLFLLVLGDLFHMSKLTTKEGNLTVGDPISFHLSIDGLTTFLYGSFLFGFPDMFLDLILPGFDLHETHIMHVRMFGCFIGAGGILSFACLCFKYSDDALDALKARLAMYIPVIILALVAMFISPVFKTPGFIILVVIFFLGSAVNVTKAVFSLQKKED